MPHPLHACPFVSVFQPHRLVDIATIVALGNYLPARGLQKIIHKQRPFFSANAYER
jgi:hypothetical protein